ncbi:MAG: M42 family metallopeptidase [Chloroflexi bacterium]|nr:M42 family metallopeptidase [Chloroflexota bacterium]
MNNLAIDQAYLLETLTSLLKIPSPTGYTDAAADFIEQQLQKLGVPGQRDRKGAVITTVSGLDSTAPRALSAHIDTLGAMVKRIKSNGRLQLSAIGSFAWNTVEGEGCRVFTAAGEEIEGSLLLTKASRHVHGAAVNDTRRSAEVMEVRLDEKVCNAEETQALGISVGDFVAFDPRLVVSDTGFIRSRHLDDKAGVACILTAIKAMQDAGIQPAQRTTFHFSPYEEVGHGAATGIPSDVVDLVAVDMAAVGEGQASDEFHVTICAKDSGGPYHYGLSQHLRQLAYKNDIPFVVDIYPYYGSDGEAYWRAGGSGRVALIGPGVDASHNYERTHMEALQATTRLILAYLLS